jgi:hypothetical protein
MAEAEVLAQVHRRARVLGVRRLVKRTVPALAVIVVLGASILAHDDGRPASLRVAGEGAPTEEAASETDGHSPEDGPRRDEGTGGEDDPPNLSITPRPVGDEPIELRSPKQLPLQPPSPPAPAMRGPHLVNDPEGDDKPSNDAIDLRYGDVAYDRGRDTLRFTFGVTDLAAAPRGIGYGVSFRYDDRIHGVSAVRHETDPKPVITVTGYQCNSCSATYDAGADEVRIDVPLAAMNDAVARNHTSYWPPEQRQSPPMGQGSTLSWFRLNAYVLRGGPIDGSDETQPHDTAESDKQWSLR